MIEANQHLAEEQRTYDNPDTELMVGKVYHGTQKALEIRALLETLQTVYDEPCPNSGTRIFTESQVLGTIYCFRLALNYIEVLEAMSEYQEYAEALNNSEVLY